MRYGYKPYKRRKDCETLERIKRWPQLKNRFPLVVIYSEEHEAYWKGEGCGYTENINLSKPISIDEAIKKAGHCGPEKQIQFVGVAGSPHKQVYAHNKTIADLRKQLQEARAETPPEIKAQYEAMIEKRDEQLALLQQDNQGLRAAAKFALKKATGMTPEAEAVRETLTQALANKGGTCEWKPLETNPELYERACDGDVKYIKAWMAKGSNICDCGKPISLPSDGEVE